MTKILLLKSRRHNTPAANQKAKPEHNQMQNNGKRLGSNRAHVQVSLQAALHRLSSVSGMNDVDSAVSF